MKKARSINLSTSCKRSNRAYLLFMLFAYTFMALIMQAESGRILSGDIALDYANAGHMTEFSFSFMLQNSIDTDDYIKVAFPFPLHSQLIPAYPATQGLSLPSGLILTYQLMDNSAKLLPQPENKGQGQVLTETIDSSNYFIRFYSHSDLKTLIPIVKDQWYYITFKIQQTEPLQYQKSSSILQIQMSTVSSVWSNAMVYDDNLAFNYFELAATPVNSISLVLTPENLGNSGQNFLIQKEYALNLDVNMKIPSYHFTENLVLKFLISEDDTFQWLGDSCSSVAKTNIPQIAELDSTLYKCSIDPAQNIMKVVLKPAALSLQTSYRFRVNIKNPPIVVKDVNVIVRAVKEESPIIIAYGQASGALSTNQIYVTSQQIFIGWGLRPDALLSFDVRVFRGDSVTPSYMPYNSLSLKFSISQSTAASTELKLIIDIPSESSAFVLESGYTNNLPAANGKVVKCVTEFASTGSSRRIGCTGVGSLNKDIVYYVGWKMFFPYDNYESPIDCTQFGTLTIYTTKTISNKDNTFFIGRGKEYLQYLRASDQFYVLGRNASYIDYMKTFLNLNLVVLTQDFQQFLLEPEDDVYITNRPDSYQNKKFNDVYVIRQNLAFMTYISLFSDIYIAARLKGQNDVSDIIKDYDTQPLLAKSTPKNTLTITTSNSKNWWDWSDGAPMSSTSGGTVQGTGLKIDTETQSLVLGLKAPYSQVTQFSQDTNTPLTNNWGMLIMMNPKIAFAGTDNIATLSSNPSSTITEEVVHAQTESQDNAYNKYTLITIRASNSDQLLPIFPSVAAKSCMSIEPFIIQDFSSIYADQYNMDIMIAMVDGIDGPLNKIKFISFFLINAFTILDSKVDKFNYGFMNYASQDQMNGSQVPTMLRVKFKGQLSQQDSKKFDSLSIFFDKLTPFFSNYHTGDIFCTISGSPNQFCKFHNGSHHSVVVKENYQSLSRIDIPLTDPKVPFDILIPVKLRQASQTDNNLYLGYQKTDQSTKVRSLQYIQAMRTISISSTPFTSIGSYGPIVNNTEVVVGSKVQNLELSAKYSGSLGVNSGDNIGAAFSYFSEWDYFGTWNPGSTITGWQNIGTYLGLEYLYYTSNYKEYLTGITFSYGYKTMKGFVFLVDKTQSGLSSAKLTIPTVILPAKWGRTIPGYGSYSNNLGRLADLASNFQTVDGNLNPKPITFTFPPAGPNLFKTVGEFVIPLAAPLDGDTEIVIVGKDGANIPFLLHTDGSCTVHYMGKEAPIACAYVSLHTELKYKLSINEEGLLPKGGSFSIVHYGLSTNATYNDVQVDIIVSSLLNNPAPVDQDLIFKIQGATFQWQGSNYIEKSTLTLGSFTQWTTNKATAEDFQFTFELVSKGLDGKNRIRFNLGQFALDNAASALNPKCKVYNYDELNNSPELSHDWSAVDSSQGLASLEIWPQKTLLSSKLTYMIRCRNFLSTSSTKPANITARVVYADVTGYLQSQNQISPPFLLAKSASAQISVTKKFTTPSTVMEMIFKIVSPGLTLDSILYLNFPSYYSSGLGPAIKCYSTYQIYCQVSGRRLMVRYMGEFTLGTTFSLTVTGVSKSINYYSGTFSFIIDQDDDPTEIQASGTFIDSVKSAAVSFQSFPTFPVLSLTQSSAFLRQEDVTITLDFYLPTTLASIKAGQTLMMVFPPIYSDVLRFTSPQCILNIKGNTLKNYVSSCSVKGMRLRMIFLDNVILGTSYSLTVKGLINPTNPSSNVKRYSFEITNNQNTEIVAKAYSPDCNYEMPIFQVNNIRKSLNYYTKTGELITTLTSMKNLQSGEIFISSSQDLSNSAYERNAYLQPLNNLYTIPSSIELSSGSNPFPIRLTALTSGVNYVYFSKSGDGSFYSNLPPLTLITNKNYFTPVKFLETEFNLPISPVNTNYSVSVTLPQELYPISEVNMTVTIPSNMGVSIRKNPTVIRFYPNKPTAFINLYINDESLWIVGATTNLVLTPGGTTYASGATIKLNAVAGVSGAPQITLQGGTMGTKNASFNVQCTEQGRIVYHVSRYFLYNTTACTLTQDQIRKWSEKASIDELRISETYYDCRDQISVINVDTPNTVLAININGLQASLDYTFEAYCQTQTNVKSSMQTINFKTQSNGGLVEHMSFEFTKVLTTTQKIKLVCALALYFSLDYYRVSTWDGYYCSELLNRRLLMELDNESQAELEPGYNPVKNLLNEYQEVHKSGNGNIKKLKQQNNSTRKLQSSSPSTFSAIVYFGINNDMQTDNTNTIIMDKSAGTSLTDQINTNVTGLPQLKSHSIVTASYQGENSISSTNDYRVETGPNYIFVEGITLQKDGLIYFIIGDNTVWTRAPLVSEIKKGSGPDGMPPAHFRVLAYRTQDPTSSYMAWTSLEEGDYTMYIMVSDDNPFDTATINTEGIVSHKISKEVAKWEAWLLSSHQTLIMFIITCTMMMLMIN